MKTTEEKIVAKALEMFNEKGIEYVGMRELAATLEMRVSNITYYFPTKDDLVNRLAHDLSKANAEILKENPQLTMYTYLEMFRLAFQNHIRFKCLFLSFVHYMTQNKVISDRYKQNQKNRTAVIRSGLSVLARKGFLDIRKEHIDHLVSVIPLIARFWVSEATVFYSDLTPDRQIGQYCRIIANMLAPYAKKKKKKEIKQFIGQL